MFEEGEFVIGRLARLKDNMEKIGDVYYKHRDFVESLITRRAPDQITPGQEHYLVSIEARYSESAVREESEWEERYDEVKRKTAVRCAHYYITNPPYFRDAAIHILDDPDHILTRRQYTKMCENKFAKKILAQYEDDPLFSVGDSVQIRATNKVAWANGDTRKFIKPNQYAVVLQVNSKPITRVAKGSRIYKVLPVGTEPIFVHESDIKRGRKIK